VPRPLSARLLLAAGSATLLSACSSSSQPPGSSASPPSAAQARSHYQVAADAYNAGVGAITASEAMFCDQSKATADLTRCQTALSQDRQSTLAFDRALRDIRFTGKSRTDAAMLLADDAALEQQLEQAATAPSLGVINELTSQILDAIKKTATDASALRGDLGLAPASPG